MNLKSSIKKLRTAAKLTQAEFAELFGVSPQSVQKWESGESRPELDNIMNISKHFGITVDSLLFDMGKRAEEELMKNHELVPDYANMHEWDRYSGDLVTEYRQCSDEGLDISKYENAFLAVSMLDTNSHKEKLADVLFDITRSVGTVPGYPYTEPSDLEEIKQERTCGRVELLPVDKKILRDKIAGAWYGRICGCTAGKNMEGIKLAELTKLLKTSGNYPMRRYIISSDITDEMLKTFSFKMSGKVFPDMRSNAPSDDDTNYTVMYQRIVEKYGRDFTPYDVSREWLNELPKDYYCTAERVAYCNFVRGYAPPSSAEYKNPYREWIGAQIRGDYFGYINPGDPEAAAEMAWRDASISHVKNGIYGEMFVAAMIAGAAVCDDICEIIRIGLSQIPAKSRLYKAITGVIDGYENGISAEECFASIHKRWDENLSHHWCHVISNAEITAASLLYCGGDYTAAIGLAVSAAFDTDCNAATVGSVIGMRNGIEGIDRIWTDPIYGKLFSDVGRVGMLDIESLVDKTMEHIEKK